MSLWFTLLYQPLLNLLIFFYQIVGYNLGLAIIAMTSFLRLILIPLTLPSLKTAKKIQELAPEINKLKIKYKDDKQALAKAQLDLYKQHGANPASGCLPQLVQLVILIALFNAFNLTLQSNGSSIGKLNEALYPSLRFSQDQTINTKFLYMDLAKPDVFHLPSVPFPLPGAVVILAAITQFISSKMMLPQAKKAEAEAEKTENKQDDLAASMQTQMLYMFPLMTLLIGVSFPSGLALYWLIFSLFSIIQQSFSNRKREAS